MPTLINYQCIISLYLFFLFFQSIKHLKNKTYIVRGNFKSFKNEHQSNVIVNENPWRQQQIESVKGVSARLIRNLDKQAEHFAYGIVKLVG